MTKNKALMFSVLGALVLVSFLGFASATISFSSSSPTTLPQTPLTGSFTINATSTANETVDFTATTITDFNGKTITFTSVPSSWPYSGAPTESKPLTINYVIQSGFDFFGKEYTTAVTAKNSTGIVLGTEDVSFVQTPFYDGANAGELSISTLNFNVLKGFGSDEKWYPLDEVELRFTVENNGDWDVENIEIQACLFDNIDGGCVFDEGDMEIDNDDFDLDSREDQRVVITLPVDIDKLTAGNTRYTFYVKAVGNVNDNNAPVDIDGDETGNSKSKDIEIVTNDNFVILDSLEIVGTPSCGETVQIIGEVWNIGDSTEDNVYLKVFNTELGISQTVNVGDIDDFDSKDLLFNMAIPDDAEEGKSYDLTFLVYDDNDDIFKNNDDDTAEFNIPLNIASGSCSAEVPANVFANLESEPKTGQEFQVRATITNTASTKKTFTVELGSYSSWATLVSIDKTSLTLDPASAGDVVVTLKANPGVSGDQNFNIVLKEGSKVLNQPVSVSVARPGFSFTGWISGLGLGGNAYLWVIGALNVILVLIIIVVAVRVVRKK